MKNKNVGFPNDLFEALKKEKEISGIPANTLIVMATRKYIEQLKKDRKP